MFRIPKPMTVAELVEFLKGQPQDLLVAYRLHSEYAPMELHHVSVQTLGQMRPDGWVPDPRPGEPTQDYLMFPGN